LKRVALLLLPLISTHRSSSIRRSSPTRPWIWRRSGQPPPLRGIRPEHGIEPETTRNLKETLTYLLRRVTSTYSGRLFRRRGLGSALLFGGRRPVTVVERELDGGDGLFIQPLGLYRALPFSGCIVPGHDRRQLGLLRTTQSPGVLLDSTPLKNQDAYTVVPPCCVPSPNCPFCAGQT
jgi:hypothetical protein